MAVDCSQRSQTFEKIVKTVKMSGNKKKNKKIKMKSNFYFKSMVYLLFLLVAVIAIFVTLQWIAWRSKFADLVYVNDSLIPAYDDRQLKFWENPVIKRNTVNASGELGVAVIVKKKRKAERLFKRHSFNQLASDKVLLNRTLKDTRLRQCLQKKYPRKLPTATVIIVFHNEAFSTLIRTVQSVIQTSPVSLLREVILVDDKSTKVSLKWHLNHFLRHFSISVRIVRMSVRSGVIKGRDFGSTFAKGDVLLFLDSHCEATEGWLPPLLARIVEDRTRIVSPSVDVIDENTFEYTRVSDELYGGFDWKLRFRWFRLPQNIVESRMGDHSLPIRSPTPNGGIFAIDSKFFNYLEKYDSGLSYFGSENIDLAFAAWMCGGSVEIIPCSRIGHIFRHPLPYSFPEKVDAITIFNAARIVETWMDDYRLFFYNLFPDSIRKKRGDLTKRLKMIERLKCKPFTWYLENVFPQSTFPLHYKYFGQIEHIHTKYCLDTVYNIITNSDQFRLRYCVFDQGGNTMIFTQSFVYTENDEILSDGRCLDVTDEHKVVLSHCYNKTSQKWFHTRVSQIIRHKDTGLCLQLNETKQAIPTVSKCLRDSKDQKWFMTDNFDWYPKFHKKDD